MGEPGERCTRCGTILVDAASACPQCGLPGVVTTTRLALRFETGPSAGTLRPLAGSETIGRRAECSIRLASATVSGRHATLEARDGELVLADCGSTNGTFVDGHRLTAPVPLRAGMALAFGEERTSVVALPPEAPATPPPQVATPPPPPPPSPTVPPTPCPVSMVGPPPPPPPPSPVPAWPVEPRRPTTSRRRGPMIAVAALVATAAVVTVAVVGWHLLTRPKVLATTTIAPEEAGGRVEVPGAVAVTIPPGALALPVAGTTEARPLERPTRLEIVEAAPPPSPDDRMTVLSAYDIRLADELLITQPLEIEIAYDPATVPDGRDPRQALLAAWYNPLTGTWGVVPAVVDTAAHKVTIHAAHLSVYGLILQWWEDVAETEHFTLCYDRTAILADVYAGEQAWASKVLAEAGRDPLGPRQGPSTAGVPTFVQDLGRMLEHSYRRYQLAGFRVPPTTWGRLTVFVYPSGYSQRGKLTGIIDITTIVPSPADYRLMTAHELFHAVEADYYQSWLPGYSKVGEMMAMNYRTWWLEASAEYAAWQIAWGGACAVALAQPKYLEDPLSLEGGAASPQHMYQDAWFLKELADHGVKFRELFEYLVDRTSAAFGMEAIGALNFTLNRLGVNQGPSEEWKHAVTLDRLEDYFLDHKPELLDRYRAFAAKLLFDTASPMAGVTSGDDLLTRLASEASLFNAAQTADERTLTPPGDYSCRLWGIRVATAPQTGPRRLRVFVDQEPPTGTGVDVFVLRGNARRAGGVRPVGTMASSNVTREVPVTVADGDAVYCLVFNRGSEPRSITVKIDTGVRLKLSSPAIPNGLPLRLYPFTADAENIPPEVRSTLLVWDFGDGSEPAEERRSGGGSAASFTYRHAYGEEKAFTLTARLFDTTRGLPTLLAEASAKVTVAEELGLRVDPPTIVAEPGDDVSFTALASGAPADAQYQWTFGDGSEEVISRSREVVHRYAAAGEFSVRVVLLDTSRPPSERELAAAEATAVIREAGPVAVLAMRVMLHTGHSTAMRRIVGSDTTYMSFDYDQEWEFSRVEAQGLEFWASATTTQDDWQIRRTLKGRLTPDRKAVERLELEEVRTQQEDTITTTSRDRLLLRDVPSVRQEFDRVICEVTGPSTAQHVAALEASYEVASPTVVGTRFELDPQDIDWQALDRSLSLTEPRPAFVRVEIIPQR